MGIGIRLEQNSHWDCGICALEEWEQGFFFRTMLDYPLNQRRFQISVVQKFSCLVVIPDQQLD